MINLNSLSITDQTNIDVKTTILLVEDEIETCEEISETLLHHGFNCVIANDVKKALELLDNELTVKIILTDIRMPGRDGLEFCRILNGNKYDTRGLVLILMTGHAGIEQAIEAIKLGAYDFLTKPISPTQLIHSIKKAEEHINYEELKKEYIKRLHYDVTEKTKSLKNKTNELVLAKEKLEQASLAKDNFLREMTHEIFTPLNEIIGYSEIVRSNNSDQGMYDNIEHIVSAGFNLRDMIQSIVDLVDSGNFGNKTITGEKAIAEDLTRIIETATAPILGIDQNTKVNEWNLASEHLTGFSKQQVIGKDLVDNFVTEDYRASVQQILDNALKGHQTASYKLSLYTVTGGRVDILINATTRRDQLGQVIGVIGIAQDMTEINKIRDKKP